MQILLVLKQYVMGLRLATRMRVITAMLSSMPVVAVAMWTATATATRIASRPRPRVSRGLKSKIPLGIFGGNPHIEPV